MASSISNAALHTSIPFLSPSSLTSWGMDTQPDQLSHHDSCFLPSRSDQFLLQRFVWLLEEVSHKTPTIVSCTWDTITWNAHFLCPIPSWPSHLEVMGSPLSPDWENALRKAGFVKHSFFKTSMVTGRYLIYLMSTSPARATSIPCLKNTK